MEVEDRLIQLFGGVELEDLRYLNAVARHIEHIWISEKKVYTISEMKRSIITRYDM